MDERPKPLLSVRSLAVEYRPATGPPVVALDGAELEVAAGEVVGVLGESGSGKTTLALAAAGLLPPEGRVIGGEIHFAGRRVERLGEKAWNALRGREIGIVFQEPALALHPTNRVDWQVAEVLRAHRGGSRRRRLEAVRELFAEVDLGAELLRAYPHQLSGGQRQRVALAQALACRPPLVIADEPTAALDAAVEARLLERVAELARGSGTAFLWISHDPDVVATIAHRVAVIYAGRVVESGPMRDVLGDPRHPYTRALLACRPTSRPAADRRLPAIPGAAPTLHERRAGCPFAPRCPHREERCELEDPPAHEATPARVVRCVLADPPPC